MLLRMPGYRKLPPAKDDIRTYFQADIPVTFPDNTTGTYRVIVMCLLGMGRVQAVVATADAIRRWHPRYIMLVGIAGGLAARNVQIGDILISDQVVDYELQKLTPEGPEVRWDVQRADPRLLNACNNFLVSSWHKLITTKRPGQGSPKCHVGPIASGDKVIAFRDILARYQDVWPKLLGVEMEAAGAATAAFQSSDRPGFFMVRAVSDLADENKSSSNVKKWRSYACDAAASFTIALLCSGPIPLSQGVTQAKTKRVELIFEGEFSEFSPNRQQEIVGVLATLLKIEPINIRILHVYQGSIVMIIEMPESAANRLNIIATKRDFRIIKLGIKSVLVEDREIIELAQKSVVIPDNRTEQLQEINKLLPDSRKTKLREMGLTADEIKNLIYSIRNLPLSNRALIISNFSLKEILSIFRELTGEERQEIIELLPESLASKLREVLIDELEIPQELLVGILQGDCVLFLGAGVSIEAGMPSSPQLVRDLEYDPANHSLKNAAQEYAQAHGRLELENIVKRRFDKASQYVKPASYSMIANIPLLNNLVVTTNYDSLLEEAFRAEKNTPVTICKEAELGRAASRSPVIIKLHGDLHQPETMVITQSDYDLLNARLHDPGGFNGFLANLISTRTVIFVGFSMADEDFLWIRNFVTTQMIDANGRATLRTHYAVIPWEAGEARVLETQAKIKVIRAEAQKFFASVFRQTSEFVNRTEELRQICEVRKEPFIEISGPSASGKTMLSKGIENFYHIQNGYLIVSIELRENETPETLLGQLATKYNLDIGAEKESLAIRVKKLVTALRGSSVLFVFDGTERAPEVVRWLKKELLPELRSFWEEDLGTGRVIFIGRQAMPWTATTNPFLYSLTLTPFQRDAVADMVGKYYILFHNETCPPRERKRIAETILRVTGTGHAGFIKAVINEITQLPKDQFPSAADLVHYIDSHTTDLFKYKLVPQLKEGILKGAAEPLLRSLQDVLCVFRSLNNSILAAIPDRGLHKFGIDESLFFQPDRILNGLKGLHILEEPRITSPLYRLDPVVGFLLSCWLKSLKPELYQRAHEIALSICDEGVQILNDSFQIAYALEGLFHLQCLREVKASSEELKDQAKQYLEQLESTEDSVALIKQFQDSVYKDADLRWMVEAEAEKSAPSLQDKDKLIVNIYDALNQAFDEELARRPAIQTEKGLGRAQ